MEGGSIGFALLLTTVAGLATAVGGALGVVFRKPGPRLMSAVFGFSAGVMIFVSFLELLRHAQESIGFAAAQLGFFAGIAVMFLVDVLVPHSYLAERAPGERPAGGERRNLMRTGLLVALGVGIHNLPEGMATFAGTLQERNLGLAIALAIGIHNIPEGLAIAAPISAATGSRKRGFLWALAAGLAEPAGAAVAALVLFPFLDAAVLGWLMSLVAGFMVFIAFDELVPASREYGHGHVAIGALVAGMAVMALSLWLIHPGG